MKGICSNCSGHLEFEEENAGRQIKCPHCGWDTVLEDSTAAAREQTESTGAGLSRYSRRLYFGAALVVVSGVLGFAADRWVLPRVEEFFPFGIERLMLWITLLAGLWAVLFLAIWTVFPVLVFLQLRRMTTMLGRLEFNTRPALARDSEPAEESEPIEGQ